MCNERQNAYSSIAFLADSLRAGGPAYSAYLTALKTKVELEDWCPLPSSVFNWGGMTKDVEHIKTKLESAKEYAKEVRARKQMQVKRLGT